MTSESIVGKLVNAGAIVEKGLETVDATVDALDGPNRHGIRGKHGQPMTG